MAQCDNLISNTLGCDENSGGIQKIWIFEDKDVDRLNPATYSVDESAHEIVLMSLGTGSNPQVFEIVENTASYTDELTTDATAQSIQWTQTLNIQKNVRNAANSRYFRVLTQGLRYLNILILDNNGNYQLMERAQLSEVNDGSGTQKVDGSKYLAVFTATNNHSMYFIDEDDAADLIATGEFGTGS